MRPWIGEYPATFLEMVDYNEILFDIELGFHLTLRQPIMLDLELEEGSRRAFLKRKLENMLATANIIFLRFFWDDAEEIRPIVDMDVDGVDLMDHLEALGYI